MNERAAVHDDAGFGRRADRRAASMVLLLADWTLILARDVRQHDCAHTQVKQKVNDTCHAIAHLDWTRLGPIEIASWHLHQLSLDLLRRDVHGLRYLITIIYSLYFSRLLLSRTRHNSSCLISPTSSPPTFSSCHSPPFMSRRRTSLLVVCSSRHVAK